MIQANQTYQMTIAAAGLAENAAGDKTCIEMELFHPDGKLWHRLWLTEATKKRVGTILAEFGINAADSSFWVEGCTRLLGMTATVSTKEETYNSKTRIVADWFNGPNRKAKESKPASQEKVAAAATLFADFEDEIPF